MGYYKQQNSGIFQGIFQAIFDGNEWDDCATV
jgi:hypothetical protein